MPMTPRKPKRKVKVGPTTPLLWNPTLSVVLGMVLTPVFGALIQMLNWRALHEKRLARQSLWWAVAGGAILLGSRVFAALYRHTKVAETFSVSLMALYMLGWLFLSAGEQGRYVREHFPRGYGHRSWKWPIPLALAGYTVYVALGFLLHWLANALG